MKKYLILLSVISCITLMTGCKEYCPAFSPDETDYLPVDFVGQTLRYVFDDDTVMLNVYPPELEEKHERNVGLEEICDPMARMSLKSSDEKTWVHYQKNYSPHDPNIFVIYIGSNRISFGYGAYRWYEYGQSEFLSEWSSPNGKTYADVWQYLENRGATGIDSTYFSPQYGLLFYHSAEHQALLLP